MTNKDYADIIFLFGTPRCSKNYDKWKDPIFWHVAIRWNNTIYETMSDKKYHIGNYKNWKYKNDDKVIIKNVPIDIKKLKEELTSGTDCATYVSRVIGLDTQTKGNEKSKYYPIDILNWLKTQGYKPEKISSTHGWFFRESLYIIAERYLLGKNRNENMVFYFHKEIFMPKNNLTGKTISLQYNEELMNKSFINKISDHLNRTEDWIKKNVFIKELKITKDNLVEIIVDAKTKKLLYFYIRKPITDEYDVLYLISYPDFTVKNIFIRWNEDTYLRKSKYTTRKTYFTKIKKIQF